MKHIIGDGSYYDADMSLVESFVRAKNEKDNEIAQAAVFNYYISQAYNYWGKLKETISDIEPESYSRRNSGAWRAGDRNVLGLDNNFHTEMNTVKRGEERNFIINNFKTFKF